VFPIILRFTAINVVFIYQMTLEKGCQFQKFQLTSKPLYC